MPYEKQKLVGFAYPVGGAERLETEEFLCYVCVVLNKVIFVVDN